MIGFVAASVLYEEVAVLAAARVHQMTGLDVFVMDSGMLARAGIDDARAARFAIFDVVDAESVMYFDADIVALKEWDPREWEGSAEFVAVADQFVRFYAQDKAIQRPEYINSGFFIANRTHHYDLLQTAREILEHRPGLEMGDQTALNMAIMETDVAVRLLPERFNYLRYHLRRPGPGSQVINAHYTPHGIRLAHQELLDLLHPDVPDKSLL